MDKRAWRARAIEERQDLVVDAQAFCAALDRFLAEAVPRSKRVVIYDAMPGEVDLAPLLDASDAPEERYAITRTPDEGHYLTVHPHGCAHEQHRYGYRQPVIDAPVVDDDLIGAVLVPALAFDRSGVRLGRGMGYYDRFLARLGSDVAFVGITGGYVVESLPSEPFDVSMTHLAFESGVQAVPVSRG
jgi:5-formyltetrahydrofolate cyclo-ligase